MYFGPGGNTVEDVGLSGTGNGLVVTVPMDHGLLKFKGAFTFWFSTDWEKGGFTFMFCPMKRLTMSSTSAAPTRKTVLPFPEASYVAPRRGENRHMAPFVSAFGTPGSP